MTDRPIALTDQLVERMLLERAGRGAPSDLVAAIVAGARSTSQRRPSFLWVPIPARARLAWFALAVTLALLALAIALVGAALLHRPVTVAGVGLIAYSDGGDIYTIQPDGSARRHLTSGGSGSAGALVDSPIWSPNNEMIAFWRLSAIKVGTGSLWVMHADGSGQRRLVDGVPEAWPSSPSWSPDSRRIAYDSSTGIPDASGEIHVDYSIHVVALDGSAPFTLAVGAGPQWSPDGRTIAYSAPDGIHTVSPDGSGDRLISIPSAVVSGPRWSPDGSEIAFEVNWTADQRDAVWVVGRAGGDAHALLAFRFDIVGFQGWSPDGRSILYWLRATDNTGPNGPFRFFITDAEGSHPRFVPVPDGVNTVTWSPDGAKLVAFTPPQQMKLTGYGSLVLVDPSGATAPITLLGGDGQHFASASWQAFTPTGATP